VPSAASAPVSAHVFVTDLADLTMDPGDQHHLSRVLRLRPGELVTASDGRGHCVTTTWRGGRLESAGPVEWAPRPEPELTIAVALTKGAKPDWAVQRLTEAGVDRVQPVVADRSIVRWDQDRTGRALERLRRVAREAAMQARRAWLPHVEAPVPFADLLADPVTRRRACLAQMGGRPPSLERPVMLVGPEGGWSPAELGSGVPAVGLGPTVLRAETAALAGGVLLAALRDGLILPAHS